MVLSGPITASSTTPLRLVAGTYTLKVSSYALPMLCPVLIYVCMYIEICISYVMCGTDDFAELWTSQKQTALRMCYAMCGTDMRRGLYQARLYDDLGSYAESAEIRVASLSCYALPTPCPVLTSRMLPTGSSATR
eukprot:2336101-Rhodomonas_salina.3